MPWQRRTFFERIVISKVRIIDVAGPRPRLERQAGPPPPGAGNEVHPSAAQVPGSGPPCAIGAARQRQRVTDRRTQSCREHPPEAIALHLVIEPRLERVDVDGKATFAPQVIEGVLVTGDEVLVRHAESSGEPAKESLRVGSAEPVVPALVGIQRPIPPRRLAVLAPVAGERPSWQLLARIPLALAEVDDACWGVMAAQAPEK